MRCRKARDLMDAFLTDQLRVETNQRVLRHLEGCPACRAEMEAQPALRAAVRRAFLTSEALQADEDFHSRAAARLREHSGARHSAKAGRRVVRMGRHVAAAVLAVAILGAGLLLLSIRASAMARDAVGDHLHCAILMQMAGRPVPLEKAAANQGDPALLLLQDTPPAEFTTPAGPVQVVRRHVCEYQGRRFGHVVMRFHGQLVSLLMTADSAPALSLGEAPHLHWLSPAEGFNIVSFRTSGHMFFLVSGLSRPDMNEIAPMLADQVYRRFASK